MKLAYDDDFRRRFETDTLKVLAENGLEVSPAVIPEKVLLPPKHELARVLPAIRAGQLVIDMAPFGPFVPGRRPFHALLLLTSRASGSG